MKFYINTNLMSIMRFMWKFHPTWIKCMLYGIIQEISNVWHVQISKAGQSPTKVRWIMISPEYASKLGIKERLCVISTIQTTMNISNRYLLSTVVTCMHLTSKLTEHPQPLPSPVVPSLILKALWNKYT